MTYKAATIGRRHASDPWSLLYMELPITNNPPVCRRLRSKGTPGMQYTNLVDFDDGFIDTATFWCLETGEPVGPDDEQVHPHVCIAPRECFKPPTEDDDAA